MLSSSLEFSHVGFRPKERQKGFVIFFGGISILWVCTRHLLQLHGAGSTAPGPCPCFRPQVCGVWAQVRLVNTRWHCKYIQYKQGLQKADYCPDHKFIRLL